jgi:hypothetical protein
MTFDARETSRTLGTPIALFLFTYGPNAGDVYGYTNAEDAVVYNGVTYAPAPIDNDAVTTSGVLDKATMQLHMSKDLAVVGLFAVWPPSTVITLRIFMGHVDEAEFKVLWSGRVLSVKTEVNDAIFSCEPISTALRRSGLRRNYQYGCPHVLYGGMCAASKAAATSNFTVQVVSSPYLTLPDNWATTDLQQKYVNGLAEWTDADGHIHIRSILRITSSTEIQLDGDVSTVSPGMAIALSYGCDHQTDDCNTLHNNIANFGGQPWIPFSNPIGVINNFN